MIHWQFFDGWNKIWLISLIIVTFALWYHKRIKIMSILKKNNIPGKRPHLIFGNIFHFKSLSSAERQKMLLDTYGKIVGYYSGAKPIVFVADPVLANKILIKDFDKFSDHSFHLEYGSPSYIHDGNLLKAKGQQWKDYRKILSPSFSNLKLKALIPSIEESIDIFLDIIENKSKNEEFNIHELYQKLSIELTIKTGMGVNVDLQNDEDNAIFKIIDEFMSSKFSNVLFLLFVSFPELNKLILFSRRMFEIICNRLKYSSMTHIFDYFAELIEIRKNRLNIRKDDILQTMIDTTLSETYTFKSYNSEIFERTWLFPNYHNYQQNKKRSNLIKLTENEMQAICVMLVGASNETTSSALAYVTHILVNYPDVQEKVRQEVIENCERIGQFDFDTLNKLQYMEWVINETLRLYPPIFNGSTRCCMNDYKYNDIVIPKDATVTICTHYLHHDPLYWPEPEKFDPMRFSPDLRHNIKNGTWLPFGDGPRTCLGKRLSYLEMKLILAKFLLKYRFAPGSKTEIGKLETKNNILANAPKNGLFVKVMKI